MRNDLKYLIGILLIFAAAIVTTFAHHGNLIIDCGREAYIPTQILAGDLLYRDIFNIYAPTSYLLNAGMFKLFGINLNVLYSMGILCSMGIFTLIYFISKEFLPRFVSFIIALFGVVVGVLNTNLFNFIFPYSFAMLYGYVGILAAIFCLIRYLNTSKKIFIYFSSLFAGFAISNKYEFIPFLIVLLYVIIKEKRFEALFFMLIVPLLSFGILFLQGLTFNDLSSHFVILNKISHSQSLKYFYSNQGVYFSKNTIFMLGSQFIKTALPLGLLLGAIFLNVKTQKQNAKMLSLVGIILSIQVISLWLNPLSFAFLPILVLILACVFYKKMDESAKVLIFSSLLLALKSGFGIATLNYGVFAILLLVVSVLYFFREKKFIINVLAFYLILVSIFFAIQNYKAMELKSGKIENTRGVIYTNEEFSKSTNKLISYIEKNTKPSDKIVILPEGAMVNFLTDRKSDNFYTSLIPLYVEVFGEGRIIAHFKYKKPEYIIFNNIPTEDYYFKNICNDYAIGFCDYVAQNYTQELVIDNTFRYLIFKKK